MRNLLRHIFTLLKIQKRNKDRLFLLLVLVLNNNFQIRFQYQNSYFMSQKHLTSKNMQYTRKKIEMFSYGLGDEIGKGYSSKVYKGRNDDTQQSVAVKVIDLKMLKNEINRTLLDSEIEILKELKNHSHILHLHDVYTTKNNTYIITELCESDLSKRIKKKLTEAEVYIYMEQIIKGYLQFHKRDIIHRDLKPANLLITHDNLVKMADFGFGIKLQEVSKPSKYNVGSPLYMAPESLRRNQYSFKSDLWALGVIFYEMLTTDTPWRAKNQKELLRKIESEKIETVIQHKNFSNMSKEFLRHALCSDKHNRMTPQDLLRYDFGSLQTGNILTEKILNFPSNDTNYISVSITSPTFNKGDKKYFGERSIENQNYSIQAPSKTYNRQNKLRTESVNESVQLKSMSKNQMMLSPTSFRKQRSEEVKQNEFRKDDTILRDNKKLISKVLIAQVHFCRFLFKLLQRIKECSATGVIKHVGRKKIEAVFQSFTGIIKHKVEQLNNFPSQNFIKCQGYREYKLTNDFQKLMKISKQYQERYKNDLCLYWNQPYSTETQPTNALIESIHQVLAEQVSQLNNPEEEISSISKDVIVLDYLITSKQLIEMASLNSFEHFARKSKIEEIVEGKNVDIHYDLYKQIVKRAQKVIDGNQITSFRCNNNSAICV